MYGILFSLIMLMATSLYSMEENNKLHCDPFFREPEEPQKSLAQKQSEFAQAEIRLKKRKQEYHKEMIDMHTEIIYGACELMKEHSDALQGIKEKTKKQYKKFKKLDQKTAQDVKKDLIAGVALLLSDGDFSDSESESEAKGTPQLTKKTVAIKKDLNNDKSDSSDEEEGE